MKLRLTLTLAVALGVFGCGEENDNPTTPTGGSPGGHAGTTAGSGGTASGGSAPTGGTAGTGGRVDPVAGSAGTGATGGSDTGGTGGKATGGADTGGTGGKAGGAAGSNTIKFVGNISSANGMTDVGNLKYADYWNQVSPQNEGKWGSVSNSKGQYNWNALDTLYKYAENNKIVFKEHTFIWGAQQPNYGITESDVKDWMTQFCKRYPNTKIIDVVNEPPPHTNPSYANSIGGGTNGDWKWIANAFKWAREACPDAVLVLNDYNNLEWDNDNKHFIDIVTAIKKLDAPIDAIGCQSHDLDHKNGSGALDVTPAGVKTRLGNLVAAVPNIYITEMDMSTKDDTEQLKLYQDFLPMFWESPNVKGITIWGWVVGMTWSMAPDSGLITRDGKKRPAFDYLLKTIGKQ